MLKNTIFFYPLLLFILISSALYISLSDYSIIQQDSLSEQATIIQNMSDREFDAFVVDYVSNAQNSAESSSTIQSNLEELGIEFIPEANGISPYFSSSDVSLSSYAAKRYGDTFYRVYGQVTFLAKENQPAKEDILAIGWDTNQASYYSYNEGDYANAREYNTSKGIFSFNIDDTKMITNSVAYGVVYVIPKTSATKLDIVATFLHTYNESSHVWSGNLTVGYDKNPSGTIQISVTSSSVGASTPFYADNTVYL